MYKLKIQRDNFQLFTTDAVKITWLGITYDKLSKEAAEKAHDSLSQLKKSNYYVSL